MTKPHCFLCQPNPRLVVAQAEAAYAMVGLGPITSAYAILASMAHLRSLADVATTNPHVIEAVVELTRSLEAVRGPLLMTEHGRVPVCRDDGDQHEAHCFHAHALLFASDCSILEQAQSYYSIIRTYPDIFEALVAAAEEEAYLLLSERADQYHILSGPLNVPRQLTRSLVAIGAGEDAYADWRTDPRMTKALRMAEFLRTSLRKRV